MKIGVEKNKTYNTKIVYYCKVCHSMGFAYALGMIEEIKAHMPDGVVKGFVSSHFIENYKWIFTRKANDEKGYVTPRN